MPRDYTLVLSRAAFIPLHAGNPQAGKAFLDYLLSLRGQKTAFERSFFFSQSEPAPDGVDAASPDIQSGINRPIPIGPALLAVSDRQKRQRILTDWKQSLGAE